MGWMRSRCFCFASRCRDISCAWGGLVDEAALGRGALGRMIEEGALERRWVLVTEVRGRLLEGGALPKALPKGGTASRWERACGRLGLSESVCERAGEAGRACSWGAAPRGSAWALAWAALAWASRSAA